MENRLRTILSDHYELDLDRLSVLPGGYRDDETWLFTATDHREYLGKCLRYPRGVDHLRSILEFQNHLHQHHNYPCARILLSKTNDLLIEDGDRLFFLQTFLEGKEPKAEFVDRDRTYFTRLGELLARWRLAARDYPLTLECEQFPMIKDETFERGLIHNDFHSNNSLVDDRGHIFLVDFVDACHSFFIADLATALFHLLIDTVNGKQRAKLFLNGYQQRVVLTQPEIDTLDQFVKVKLTLSIEEDLEAADRKIDPFIQSCLDLLRRLNDNSELVKDLIDE